MSDNRITVVYKWTAQEGKLDELKSIYSDVTNAMQENEPDAEAVLELLNMSAEPRFGDAQCTPCRRKSALLHDVGEIEVIIQVHRANSRYSFHI